MTKTMQNAPIISLVDYPGVQKSALWGLADLFGLVARLSPDHRRPAPGVRMINARTLSDAATDAVIFPPSLDPERPAPTGPLLTWVRERHDAGALAASVCAGAAWLAEAGLLDGRPATTHWALEDSFRRAWPGVDLRPERILVDDGDIVTAGGLMAWIDLGLHLTGRWYGSATVSRLARHLLVDPTGREQRHYSSFQPPRHHGDAAILRAQKLVDRDPATPDVPALAAASGLGLRSLQRRFPAATGLSPSSYLQAARIEKARAALEGNDDSIAEIAWSVGYRDTAAFGRAFRAVTGLAPGAYRRRFGLSQVTGPLSSGETDRI